MRRASASRGVVLCFLMNLLFHLEWIGLALVLLGLHVWLGCPRFLVYFAVGIWLVQSLLLTALVCWGSQAGRSSIPQQENKNPYSAKTTDLLPNKNTHEHTQQMEEPREDR